MPESWLYFVPKILDIQCSLQNHFFVHDGDSPTRKVAQPSLSLSSASGTQYNVGMSAKKFVPSRIHKIAIAIALFAFLMGIVFEFNKHSLVRPSKMPEAINLQMPGIYVVPPLKRAQYCPMIFHKWKSIGIDEKPDSRVTFSVVGPNGTKYSCHNMQIKVKNGSVSSGDIEGSSFCGFITIGGENKDGGYLITAGRDDNKPFVISLWPIPAGDSQLTDELKAGYMKQLQEYKFPPPKQ